MADISRVRNFTIIVSNLLESSEASSIFISPVSQVKSREVKKLVLGPYSEGGRTKPGWDLLTAGLGLPLPLCQVLLVPFYALTILMKIEAYCLMHIINDVGILIYDMYFFYTFSIHNFAHFLMEMFI